jgi:hypothetical protein
MSDTQEKRENNQTEFTSGRTTKDAEECDFGTGIPSFYEAPDMHFVSLHASFLQRLLCVFPVAMQPGRSGEYAKIVFSGFFKLLSGTCA